jgi:pimeloyl-ACP methyl ester carboxylesterase
MALMGGEWGFRLEDVTVPVRIWQGTDDRNVPLAHAEYMAAVIPDARLHRYAGEGHLLLEDHLHEMLHQLIDATTTNVTDRLQ